MVSALSSSSSRALPFELASAICAIPVFVLASDFESFGIVVAESLSAGTPVVVSDKTPWKDIQKNKCGIFTNNNPESFYNAFCKITKMKFDENNLKNYISANFDWNIITNKFIEIFNK